MSLPIHVTDLDVRFGRCVALDGVSLGLAAGTICGLLGRNGAGKSTLLRVLAAYLAPDAGQVRVDGEDPYENARVMSQVCLVRPTGDLDETNRVRDEIELCELLRPGWDGAYAERLLTTFGLRPDQKVASLSTGKQAALSIVIGLASRASLTMFDEPHLSLDAPSRVAFYDELLADYLAHPRTVIISTHLISEIAPLLEEVVILDEARLLLHAAVDDLHDHGAQVTGPAEVVDEVTAGLRVLSERRLGTTKAVAVLTPLDGPRLDLAAAGGVEVGPIPLQELFIGLTSKERTS